MSKGKRMLKVVLHFLEFAAFVVALFAFTYYLMRKK